MFKRLWTKYVDWLNEETYRESWEKQNKTVDELRLRNTRNLKALDKQQKAIEKAKINSNYRFLMA